MEACEHRAVGNSITLDLCTGQRAQATSTPLLAGALNLRYGEVVALGGDFYGQPTANVDDSPTPISDSWPSETAAEQAFLAAWGTLAGADQAPQSELSNIMAIMNEEQAAIDRAVHSNPPRQPSWAYEQLKDTLSRKWIEATGGAKATSPSSAVVLYPGRYMALALVNMDHFAYDAVFAYTAGHAAAMKQASQLYKQDFTQPSVRQALLKCYAMNAFADHFLTDLFAAGHLRTPRRPLYNMPTTIKWESGLLARLAHDEDNLHGVTVSNAKGETWLAYGDKMELDDVNAENLRRATVAVQASADEVANAASTGQIPTTANLAALQMIPKLDEFFRVMPTGAGEAVKVALFVSGANNNNGQIGWLGEGSSGPGEYYAIITDEAHAVEIQPYHDKGNLYWQLTSDTSQYMGATARSYVYFYSWSNTTAWTVNQDETILTSVYTGAQLSYNPTLNDGYLYAYSGSDYVPLVVELYKPDQQQKTTGAVATARNQTLQLTNYAPLFWAGGNGHDATNEDVYRRGGLLGNYEDRDDFNYTRVWSAAKMMVGNLPDT